jgi:hypothetical protein
LIKSGLRIAAVLRLTFIGSGIEHVANVFHVSQTASDREWHKALRGGAFDDLDHGSTFVARGCDVEENEFIGTLLLVGLGLLNRIPRVD